MSKPKSPTPPDPQKTAAAQTGTNVGTAVANAYLNNISQKTPYGSLNYNQTGTTKWTDPTSGEVYDIPKFEAVQSLSPHEQKLLGVNNQTETNLAKIGRDQSAKVGNLLGSNLNFNGLPRGGNAADIARSTGGLNYGWGIGRGVSIDTSAPRQQQVQGTFGGAGAITRSYGDDKGYAQQRQRVENALMQRMNPQLARDQEALRTSLVNQGVTIGSEAYDRAMEDAGKQRNDARMGAILGAGEEQSRLAALDANRAGFQNTAQQQAYDQALGRGTFANAAAGQRFAQDATGQQVQNAAMGQLFGQNLQAAGFQNQAQQQQFGQSQALFDAQNAQRSQALNERMTQRNAPLNEISALMSGSQVQQPQFTNTPSYQIPTTDYAGLMQGNYANQMAGYQQQMQSRNAMMGGLFGMAGNLGAGYLMGG